MSPSKQSECSRKMDEETRDDIQNEEGYRLESILMPQFYDSHFLEHFIKKNPIETSSYK